MMTCSQKTFLVCTPSLPQGLEQLLQEWATHWGSQGIWPQACEEAGSLLTSQSERSAGSKVLRPAQLTFLCWTPREIQNIICVPIEEDV